MTIRYDSVTPMPEYLTIHSGGEEIVFNDAGVRPDGNSGDRIYSAYLKEDLDAFLATVEGWEAMLASRGYYTKFYGHSGEVITDSMPAFDRTLFETHNPTPLHLNLIQAIECDDELKKQHSLFKTDLSVVEDPARTFNVHAGTGNPTGAWTFGTLMKNMVIPVATTVSAKTFLKEWVKTWTVQQLVNGQSIPPREDIFKHVIVPWLTKARFPSCSTTITPGNWQMLWNDDNCVSEANLLKWAPFRLMAIVNRIDLRGNMAYKSSVQNAGETRFIFTLIDPTTGMPPIEDNQTINSTGSFIDWQGMNVILEYHNVQTNRCELQQFAQGWLDLSSYTSFGSAYNDALESLTNTVTNAGAMPGKPNGSALAQLRTNERILQDLGGNKLNTVWESSDWQFRQFEIDNNTKLLKMMPLNNTPTHDLNFPINIATFGTTAPTNSEYLMKWLWDNLVIVSQGRHRMPAVYPGTTIPITTGAAQVPEEQMHYWDVNWSATTSTYTPASVTASNADLMMDARFMLSLNTCNGCHNGETKTIFTQMRPLGYGESAKYWLNTPEYLTGGIDTRFRENYNFTGPNVPFPLFTSSGDWNYSASSLNGEYFQKVSAFLTGVRYSGTAANPTFEDDEPGENQLGLMDNELTGFFYVNEPKNGSGPISGSHPQKRRRFNDLKRRHDDLCKFLNTNCNGPKAIDILVDIQHMPLALGGH